MSHNSIKLYPAKENTELDATHGKSALSNSLFLGAVIASKHRPHKDIKYGTDNEGLQVAIDKSGGLVEHLHSSLTALNAVLAYTDLEEVKEDLPDVFWLMCGLSELAQNISREAGEMQYHLDQNDTHKKTRKASEA